MLPAQPRSLVDDHLARVDARLEQALADLDQVWAALPDDSDGPVDVLGASDLPQFIRALVAGGKRLRPSMSYLGWLAGGGRTRGVGYGHVVTVGAALELLHVFALVHDDVMDESASRRGQPTVHLQASALHESEHRPGAPRIGSSVRFGESIAVLTGDLAHAESNELAASLPLAMRGIWRVLVAELIAGQRRDLVGSAAGRRDLAFARTVARMKSGRYTVERPLELGAAAAGAGPDARACLAAYGRAIGEAFALRDDLLGIWGEPLRTGKPTGDDLVSGKPTVILSLAQDRVTGAARGALDRAGMPGFTPADLCLLQAELQRLGVRELIEQMICERVDTALEALADGSLDPDGVSTLSRMADRIAWRDR